MSIRSEKLQKRIDGLMEQIPRLPKDFEKWMQTKVFMNSRYIFYKRKGRKIHGVCSVCGEQIILDKATHNTQGKCPNCKAKVTFKAINKAKRYKDTEIVTIMQKIKNGYTIRYFRGILTFKDYDDTTKFPEEVLETLIEPKFSFYEGSREIITFTKQGKTKWEEFEELWSWQIHDYEWKKERRRSPYFNKELLRDSNPVFYTRNLKRLLKNTKWKYCGLDYYKGTKMNIGDYIHAYESEPAIEYLSKFGFKNLLAETINTITYYGMPYNSPMIDLKKKMLGLDKKTFERALRLNMGSRQIEFLQTLNEIGYKISDQEFTWAVSNTNTETFTQMLQYATAHKIIRYVEKQTKDKDTKHTITSWIDYMNQCRELKIDVKSDFVIFPRDLFAKHDEYTKLIKINESKVLNQGIKIEFDKWNESLNYKSGNLSIEVAGSHKSIIDEGIALRHCVGGNSYSEKIGLSKILILFLKKNNKPYCTIELRQDDLKILQKGMYRMEEVPKDVVKFINKWKVKRLLSIRDQKVGRKEAI